MTSVNAFISGSACSVLLCATAIANEAIEHDTQPSTMRPTAIKRCFARDITRYSLGFGSLKLRNPVGFDVASEVYENGVATEGIFGFDVENTLSVSLEKRVAREGVGKRLWTFSLDAQDFEGLELTNFIIGYGYALSPPDRRRKGFRIAGGVGAGVTRSETYFDSNLHSSIEAWAAVGLQFRRFVIDLTRRERKTIERTLDERSAGPITSGNQLTFGWLF